MRPEQIIEATLFASQTPLTPAELARADEDLTAPRVREVLQTLRERYEEDERAFQLYQLGDGYQLLTRPEYAPYLERFDSVPRPPTLSRAALETLAIIAYRQPIGRIEIEEIRGVAATSVLRTLLDWELIDIVARGEGLGRPLLYGTTAMFLDHFGFQSLEELPRPEDLPIALRRVEELGSTGLETHPVDEAAEAALPADADTAGGGAYATAPDRAAENVDGAAARNGSAPRAETAVANGASNPGTSASGPAGEADSG